MPMNTEYTNPMMGGYGGDYGYGHYLVDDGLIARREEIAASNEDVKELYLFRFEARHPGCAVCQRPLK